MPRLVLKTLAQKFLPREMAQQLRQLTHLSENPDSVPSTQVVSQSGVTPGPEDAMPSSGKRHKRGIYTHMQANTPGFYGDAGNRTQILMLVLQALD